MSLIFQHNRQFGRMNSTSFWFTKSASSGGTYAERDALSGDRVQPVEQVAQGH